MAVLSGPRIFKISTFNEFRKTALFSACDNAAIPSSANLHYLLQTSPYLPFSPLSVFNAHLKTGTFLGTAPKVDKTPRTGTFPGKWQLESSSSREVDIVCHMAMTEEQSESEV